jgi:hypothetical protein
VVVQVHREVRVIRRNSSKTPFGTDSNFLTQRKRDWSGLNTTRSTPPDQHHPINTTRSTPPDQHHPINTTTASRLDP